MRLFSLASSGLCGANFPNIRMIRLLSVGFVLGLSVLVWAGNISAHQQKAAITEILFNPRTGNIEVSHRFLLHDAEHAVRLLFDPKADIISDEQTQDRFARYVTESFDIALPVSTSQTSQTDDNRTLALSLVGHEIERQWMWIYQEIAIPEGLNGLEVAQQAMTDLWESQYNTVNIKRNDKVQTLVFVGRRLPETVYFQSE